MDVKARRAVSRCIQLMLVARTTAANMMCAPFHNGPDGVHGRLAVARGWAAGVRANKAGDGRQHQDRRYADRNRGKHMCSVQVHGGMVVIVVMVEDRR